MEVSIDNDPVRRRNLRLAIIIALVALAFYLSVWLKGVL